ncbi:DUF4149 domain-containing protein [Roseibium sp. HPY-6]|uniref:DUF4149 domain-containing protein n=1 Tax=Roseibium sp. HPY-6 TaxID=3229852 RepID=UPI00338DB73E
MMETVALLVSALLFGGMVLYAFGFAAFVFSALPPEVASPTIRRAFPFFYLFVFFASAIAAICLALINAVSAGILAAIALSTVPTRQILMPAINHASDANNKARFKLLHSLSVIVTLAHIAAAAYVLTRFI